MSSSRFHGTDYESILSIAENGVVEGSDFSEDEMFGELNVQRNVYGTDKGVWITDNRECAETYAWGGGYLVIDTSNLKVIEDQGSCYDVIPGDLSIENVEKIFLEENTQSNRDFLSETASKLEENGYGEIELEEYQGPEFEI